MANRISPCANCGEPGMHFVPPSFGEPGFYLCCGFVRSIDEPQESSQVDEEDMTP